MVVLVSLGLLLSGRAGAHNSLDSSVPPSGSALAAAPTVIELNFKKDVPLDSFSSTLTMPDGSRADLAGSAGARATQVRVQVPSISSGAYSLRWKLVSADGHAISDTVEFSVQAAAPTSAGSTAGTGAGISGAGAGAPSGLGGTSAPSASAVPPADQSAEALSPAGQSLPVSVMAWALRLAAFGAFAVLTGGLLCGAFLWPQRWTGEGPESTTRGRGERTGLPDLPRTVGLAIATLAAASALTALIAAGEVVGQSPWTAVDDLWSTMRYGSVRGAIERVVAAGALGGLVFVPRGADGAPRPLDPLVAGVGLVAIALAFSFSGHPASLAVPVLGVPLDVTHQLAAGAWLGGMVFLGPLAGPGDSPGGLDQWRGAVLRFTGVARWAVIVLLVTGVAQSLRIDGSPLNLFRTGHGRSVLLKIVLFALMLWAGNVNRERIARRLEAVRQPASGTRWALRRAMATELVMGLAILATTAILVSLSPA